MTSFLLLAATVSFALPRTEPFGGFGFQNAEAELTALMPDDFRDERVLKTFSEISPSFSRVYAGLPNVTREQTDRFADYYDRTFRRAGTELYAVGGQMPWVEEDEIDAYAEKVAANLDYLVHVRHCDGIRRYCLTNELGVENRGDWFVRHMDVFRAFHVALRRAFDRHGLSHIGLAATDVNNHVDFSLKQLDWATKHMDDITESYVTHWYMYMGRAKEGFIEPSSPQNAAVIDNHFEKLVAKAAERGKRYFVGEFGLWTPPKNLNGRVMHDDTGYSLREPTRAADGALLLAEIALSAMNAGAYAAASWSFVDYPDPFIFEPGDTPEDRRIYESACCTVWPDRKYNKWGVFRWSSVDRDYRAYPTLYTLGLLARSFRGASHVLPRTLDDATLRAGAVQNADGSLSVALLNWGEEKSVDVRLPKAFEGMALNVFQFAALQPLENAFNDLPAPVSEVRAAARGESTGWTAKLPSKSLTVFSSSGFGRRPAAVRGLRRAGETLVWDATDDADFAYYRVFADGRQIASTVAPSLSLVGARAGGSATRYSVLAVDRFGNSGDKGEEK